MKHRAVIRRLAKEAKSRGLESERGELSKHTVVRVGRTTHTIGRHAEIDEVTARKFFDQFAEEFGGKGWWR